jgi:hypothetical protein
MDPHDHRTGFLSHIAGLCELLSIDAPPPREGDSIAFRLDLDELTFVLKHSVTQQPALMLARCWFGKAGVGGDRVDAMAAMLQANAHLAKEALGTISLDAEAEKAACTAWMTISENTAEQTLDKLLRIRELTRDFAQRGFQELIRKSSEFAIRP